MFYDSSWNSPISTKTRNCKGFHLHWKNSFFHAIGHSENKNMTQFLPFANEVRPGVANIFQGLSLRDGKILVNRMVKFGYHIHNWGMGLLFSKRPNLLMFYINRGLKSQAYMTDKFRWPSSFWIISGKAANSDLCSVGLFMHSQTQ